MDKLKITKFFTTLGSTILILMALFHGSGLNYITGLVQESNLESFVKEIFPVLFIHPSIQLLGLAGFGILTLFMKYEKNKILFFIALLVVLNSLLAFHLGANISGILLASSSFIFAVAGITCTKS